MESLHQTTKIYVKLSGESLNLENAADFIRCGACAVSGARVFMNHDKIKKEGFGWITNQVRQFIELIRETKKNLPDLP